VIRHDDVVGFVYREARLLDEQRFDEWLELFTEDGRYWMPLEHGQTDRRLMPSLMDEDLLLLRIRVERLKGIRTYSPKPPSRCHHVLQQPQVDYSIPRPADFPSGLPCTTSRLGGTGRIYTPPGRHMI
jgi:3-phenylpropionate/cinnamic acid dioxygenase small subunit